MNNIIKILIGCLFTGCVASKGEYYGEPNQVIKVDYTRIDTIYKASNVFSSIKLIPLETTEQSIIKDFNKVLIVDDKIFVLDLSSHSILIFDLDGKYLNKIANRGRANNEYLEISDFIIANSKEIIILDCSSKKINIYNQNGNFIESHKIPLYADAIEELSSNIYALNGSSKEDRVILWNRNTKQIENSFMSYDIKYSGRGIKPFIRYNKTTYFTHAFSNVVYKVSPDSLNKEILIDFGKYNIDDSKLGIGMYGMCIPTSPIAEVNRVTVTSNYVAFEFQCEALDDELFPFYVFYNKHTKEQIILHKNNYKDDILNMSYPPDIMDAIVPTGKLFCVTLPHILLSGIIDKSDSANPLINKIKSLTLEDNPIILIYNLK